MRLSSWMAVLFCTILITGWNQPAEAQIAKILKKDKAEAERIKRLRDKLSGKETPKPNEASGSKGTEARSGSAPVNAKSRAEVARDAAIANLGIAVDEEPKLLVKIAPQYPRRAIERGIEGYVTIEFLVMADGSVSGAKIMDANPRRYFDREALKAVRKWKYRPAIADGKAVISKQTTRLDFRLDN